MHRKGVNTGAQMIKRSFAYNFVCDGPELKYAIMQYGNRFGKVVYKIVL